MKEFWRGKKCKKTLDARNAYYYTCANKRIPTVFIYDNIKYSMVVWDSDTAYPYRQIGRKEMEIAFSIADKYRCKKSYGGYGPGTGRFYVEKARAEAFALEIRDFLNKHVVPVEKTARPLSTWTNNS